MNSDIKETHRIYQLLKRLVKYGTVALALLCTAHCGLLCVGYDLISVHILLCLFLFVLCLCLSQLFSLCWVHKLCVTYACSVVLCTTLRHYGMFPVFGINLDVVRTTMYSIGLFITGLILWKVQKKSC